MADGYGIGMSATPINLTSGAVAFGTAAAAERLRQIDEDKEQVSENYKNLLKASSLQALPELMNEQRYRYEKKIDDYKNNIRDMFKQSGGKLTDKQKLDIQNGFLKLQSDMQASVLEGQELAKWSMMQYDPNFDTLYDRGKFEEILGQATTDIINGKPHKPLSAMFMSAVNPMESGTYMSKKFGESISTLDIETLGTIKGNIFETIKKSGLAVGEGNSYDKALRLRNQILQDPFFKNKYTNPDGTVNDVLYKEQEQKVDDYISQVIRSQQKGYAPRSSSASQYTPYINTQPYQDKVGDKNVTVNSSISLTDTPAFAFGKRKVAPEAIEYQNTAVSEKAYRDAALAYYKKEGLNLTTAKKLIDDQVKKNLIIDDKFLPYFKDGEYENKAYVKVQYPDKPEVDFSDLTSLLNTGTKTVVDYIPYENQSLKNALGGKLAKKRESIFNAAESLGGELNKKQPKQELSVSAYNKAKGTNVTKAQLESQAWAKDYIIVD